MNKTITIVTPSLNQGKYIEQTIISVLSQKGNFYIDYIISDGGSTDESLAIIKKYDRLIKEKLFPINCNGINYRWWSEKDKGQSHAINKGFKIAKGDMVAWINSDDYYESGAFEEIIKEFARDSHVDLIYGDGYVLNEIDNTKSLSSNKPGNIKLLLEGKYYIFQPSTFFTKRILNQIGLLDENLHYAMDYDLWIRIFKNGKTLHVNKCFSAFRIWDNSKSGSQQKKFLADRKKVFKKHGGNIIDPEIIYIIRDKIPFLNTFSKKNYAFYKIIKTIFYNIINRIKYKI